MPDIDRLTREVLALRGLGRCADGRFVDWAIEMLMAGHDTPGLCVLAGEAPPFQPFEMAALVDRVFGELRLEPHVEAAAAAREFAAVRIEQLRAGEVPRDAVLHELGQLCLELDHLPDLVEFYQLDAALTDLRDRGVQYHYPTATRDELDAMVERAFVEWPKNREAS